MSKSSAGMTFEQLRIFLTVAHHLHFTRASEFLFLTQPAVSAAIQRLEEQYEVKLFARIGRQVELTPAGKFLQIEANQLLDQLALIERGLREFNDLQRGDLKLGASLTIGNYWLPGFISQFKRQYPGVKIHATLNNTEAITAGTINGLFDLGLIAGVIQPGVADYLEQHIVGGDRLQIIVGCSHPWFERSTITLPELLTTAWIMREAGSGTQQRFEQTLRNWGISPENLTILLEMNSSEMVKAAVEDGVGIAAISELLIAKEIKLKTLKVLKVIELPEAATGLAEMHRPFLLLKHPKRFQTRVSRVFEQLLTTSKLPDH